MGSTVSQPTQHNPMADLGQAISNTKVQSSDQAIIQDQLVKQAQATTMGMKQDNILREIEITKARKGLEDTPTPTFVKDAKETIKWLKSKGEWDENYPLHGTLKLISQGKALPTSISEDVGGSTMEEIHGLINLSKGLFSKSL